MREFDEVGAVNGQLDQGQWGSDREGRVKITSDL